MGPVIPLFKDYQKSKVINTFENFFFDVMNIYEPGLTYRSLNLGEFMKD